MLDFYSPQAATKAAISRASFSKTRLPDPRAQIVIALIEKNYHRKLSRAEMAVAVNLSVSRLAHVFKSAIGISPEHYLAQLRLDRAKRDLETSFRPIKEVARLAGARDVSHFTKAFKAVYGLTPADYRKSYLARNYQPEFNSQHDPPIDSTIRR